MAVGADQLALRDLVQDRFAAESPQHEVAHLTPLIHTRQMVPLHRCVMENATAVGTWPTILQLSVPGEQSAAVVLAHL
jgi:hypothetical protein